MANELKPKEINLAKKYFAMAPYLEEMKSENPGISEKVLVDMIRERKPELGFPTYGTWAQCKKFAKRVATDSGMSEISNSRQNPFWTNHAIEDVIKLVNEEGFTPREAIKHLIGEEVNSYSETTIDSLRNTYIRKASEIGEYFPFPQSALLSLGRKINIAVNMWNEHFGTKLPLLSEVKKDMIESAEKYVVCWDNNDEKAASSSQLVVKCPICGNDISYRQARQAFRTDSRNKFNALWCASCRNRYSKLATGNQ